MHVLPLTFAEYKPAFNLSDEQIWSEYITTGGIPLVANMNSNSLLYQFVIMKNNNKKNFPSTE